MQEKYLVSACLAGMPCRFDGTHKNNEYINKLIEEGKAIPICPEQLGGLPTPREACECKTINKRIKVVGKDGKDYTKEFIKGSEIVLEIAKKYKIKKAILQKNSPSCGLKRYDGSFSGKVINQKGITAKKLTDNGIEVISIEQLEKKQRSVTCR